MAGCNSLEGFEMRIGNVCDRDTQCITRDVFSKLIRKAQNVTELKRLELQCTKHYQAGTLSASDFGKLDVKIMEKIGELQ
jgi:hypothetical protein